MDYRVEKGAFVLEWMHTFEAEDVYYFAYTYPYSYTDSMVKT